jgi:hypothetical protein
VGDKGGNLRLWETSSKDYFVWLPRPSETDYVAFSPDGKFLVCGSSVRTKLDWPGTADRIRIVVWDVLARLSQKGLK